MRQHFFATNKGQNNMSHAKICVSPFLVSILLFCQYSAQGTVCSGKFTFWFFFFLEWSNVILSGTSEFQNQIEKGLSKKCCNWVLDILSCFDVSIFAKVFGRKGVAMLKTGLKIIPNNTVLTSKGTRLLQMIFTLDVLL